MNRCYAFIKYRFAPQIAYRITPQILLALLVICVGALVSYPQTTLAQSAIRPFPAAAKRGLMEVQAGSSILINGAATQLSPGARIRGANNMLVMSGQLVGQRVVVNYVRDTQGSVHEVWILNSLEARQQRPGSEPTTNILFESTPPKPNSYFK